MVNIALYSFMCQSLPEYRVEGFHHLCFKNTLASIIHAIKAGTNIYISDPEAMASEGGFTLNPDTRRIEWTSPISCGTHFPYDNLCVWHTSEGVQHLICVHRLSPNVIYVNSAYCVQPGKVINQALGVMDYSWTIIPYGALYTHPFNSEQAVPVLTKTLNIRLKTRLEAWSTLKGVEYINLYREGETAANYKLAVGFFNPNYLILMGLIEKLPLTLKEVEAKEIKTSREISLPPLSYFVW